jgi:hypothetical protein
VLFNMRIGIHTLPIMHIYIYGNRLPLDKNFLYVLCFTYFDPDSYNRNLVSLSLFCITSELRPREVPALSWVACQWSWSCWVMVLA